MRFLVQDVDKPAVFDVEVIYSPSTCIFSALCYLARIAGLEGREYFCSNFLSSHETTLEVGRYAFQLHICTQPCAHLDKSGTKLRRLHTPWFTVDRCNTLSVRESVWPPACSRCIINASEMAGVKGGYCQDVWKSLCPHSLLHLDAFWCPGVQQNSDNRVAVTRSTHTSASWLPGLCLKNNAILLCHSRIGTMPPSACSCPAHFPLHLFIIFFLLPNVEAGMHSKSNLLAMIIADVIIFSLITVNSNRSAVL